MLWVDSVSKVTVQVAVLPPSVKATVPVGVPAPGAEAETVAVKVTAPSVEGFAEDTSAVAAVACPTTWSTAVEVEPANAPSPLYTAVMLWLPSARVPVVRAAWPLTSTVAGLPS